MDQMMDESELSTKICPFCEYSWQAKVENPKSCPRCKRYLKVAPTEPPTLVREPEPPTLVREPEPPTLVREPEPEVELEASILGDVEVEDEESEVEP